MSKTALFDAAKRWDAAKVTRLVSDAPGLVTATDARGRTALHLCAGQPAKDPNDPVAASVATAMALLRAGADVDAVHEIPDDGEVFPATPLWYAVARGRNLPLVQALLRAGANPDHCLWAVVWASDLELMKLLLDAGSRTDLTFDGETPLIYAARLGREFMIPDLLKAKADPAFKDSKGRTALDHAVKRRLSDEVITALGGAPLPRRVSRGRKQARQET